MRPTQAFVRRHSSDAIFLVAWAVFGLMALGKPAVAQTGSPIAFPSTQFSSGMVGLAPGQTARLNVVNVSQAASPLPCVLAIAFLDSNSKALKQMFVSLAAGKAAYMDMAATDPGRVEIRAIGYNPLLATASAIPQPVSCTLVPTLELFDTLSGRTSVVLADFKDLTRTWW